MPDKRLIKNCSDCPARQTPLFCAIAGTNLWSDTDDGLYEGGPAPEKCPLRKESVTLQLEKPCEHEDILVDPLGVTYCPWCSKEQNSKGEWVAPVAE